MANLSMASATEFVMSDNAKDVKIGMISDVHLKLAYDADVSEKGYCSPTKPGKEPKTGAKALIGRLGCTSPESLVKSILQLMVK